MSKTIESIDNLDEAKILGYFESMKGVFLTKLAILLTFAKEIDGISVLDKTKFAEPVLTELKKAYPREKVFFDALELENEELFLNYQEDILTSLFSSSWYVFEQIIKDIPNPDYAHKSQQIGADFRRSDFGFSKREKADLELIYYIRNGIQHYNGAYYSESSINHTYDGHVFVSDGHIGEKMEITLQSGYKMCCDLERLACKAWTSYRALAAGRETQES